METAISKANGIDSISPIPQKIFSAKTTKTFNSVQ